MKKYTLFLLLLLMYLCGKSQIYDPVEWTFTSKNIAPGHTELIMTGTIEYGWHLYSQFIEKGGPVPTSFTFTPSPDFKLDGKVEERSTVMNSFDENFSMDIAYFSEKAVFVQKVKLSKAQTTIKGTVEFMVCNDKMCLPPNKKEFSIKIENELATTGEQVAPNKNTTAPAPLPVEEAIVSETANEQAKSIPEKNTRSIWTIFIAGILGGFAAFFMPCIFPMLPFTVSYFTKAKSKRNTLIQSLMYGVFIVIIYVSLGILITVVFGADALNNLATNGIFNLFFFILLVVFAFSFFGAFELVLPSSWVNKADAKSNKGGMLGLFFMAATLSIVSFSCTGPIIGTLLVEAATMGHLMGPAIGMFGFALALALPFTLFSMFPSWLKSMPKSGSWLNSVKVVLGFLELALALKFLSNVDLAYHWNWFDREVFLVLWIAIFGIMALYLLGKLKMPADGEMKHISPFRLMLSVLTIAFTLYMVPGLWGAPLKAVAAFLPPQQSQDFDLYTPTLGANYHEATAPTQPEKKYGDIFHAPYGLNAFFDYEEGLEYAKKENKPVLIDFTGHACVNCRKMEADVWSDKNVLELLFNEYVLIQLYVDDKTELPLSEQTISAFSGKKIKTIGNKWSDFQAARFNSNSQPFYVLLDTDGNLLVQPQGANYNAENFVSFLKQGVKAFSDVTEK